MFVSYRERYRGMVRGKAPGSAEDVSAARNHPPDEIGAPKNVAWI